MKTLFLLAATVLLSACSKKDEDVPAVPDGGSYTIEGKTYPADYAYWTVSQGLTITNKPQAPEYIENSVQISVDSLHYSNTFTYLGRSNITYDNKKNFFSTVVRYTPSGVYGEGHEITGVTGGTLNVSREGKIFTVKFNITVAGRPIEGSYVGEIQGKRFE
jgi:hypothetical protein